MQHRLRRRATAWLGATALCVGMTACGENPLESVGQRSSEWIGPVSDGVSFLSNDAPVSDVSEGDADVGPVSVSEGDG